MANNFILYEPREDTFLLQKHIKEYAHGNVLEIGTGSGILAQKAAASNKVKRVLAVDIQEGVIEHCKKTVKSKKILFKQSDLFANIKRSEKFDCIFFNPPYLPADPRDPDVTLDAGKKGYEIIVRFLDDVNSHLASNGTVLLLFSSFSRQNIIDDCIAKNLLEAKQIDQQHISFETLYVYALTKSSLLKELEDKNVNGVHYFARGKRGIVYKGNYHGNKIIVKVQHPLAETPSTVQFEAQWLRKLNPHKIGPKLFFSTDSSLVMEFVDGVLFVDFIQDQEKKAILLLIKKLFQQMYTLDNLGINKYEMNHPDKHIIIRRNTPILIDFERCRYTEDPKNVTQVVQYLCSQRICSVLKIKGIHIPREALQNMARLYKFERTRSNYHKIIKLIN